MKSVKSQHFSYLSIFQLILKPIIKQPKNKPYQNHKNQFKKFVARVLIFFQIYSSLFQGIAYGGYGLLENLPIQDEIYLHGGYAKDGGLRLSLWTSTLTSQKTELLKEIEIPTYEGHRRLNFQL